MIDILLATFNGEKYIKSQLDSIFAQSYKDFHVYARDDGSKDSTVDILNQYKKSYPDKLTVICDLKSTGSAQGNFFELLKYGEGDYVFFADQDDVWEENKLEICFEVLSKYKKPALVHTDMEIVDENINVISESFFQMQKLDSKYTSLNRLMVQNNVTGCAMCFNKELKQLIKPSEYSLQHDWWIAIICSVFGEIKFLEKPTVKYRQHGENQVGAKDVRNKEYMQNKLANINDVHTSIVNTYKQAEAFLDLYKDNLQKEQIAMLKEFSQLQTSNSIKRFKVLNKYKAFKSGLYRKIGQIIYG